MKNAFIAILCLFLFACGGSSDSGGAVENSQPGDMLPANFVGTYTGMLNLTASAAGLSESDSFPITITVFADGTIRFEGDDPEETFTVGVTNAGAFSGSVDIVEDECSGTINLTGSVDGTTASGNVDGSGTCTINGLSVDVDLAGDFSASM